MNSVIQELWYGSIIPQNDCRPQNDQIKHLSDLIVKNRNELIFSLNKEQSEIFDNLDTCLAEYVTAHEEAIFSYAFKLGMRMAAEAFGESLDKEQSNKF